MHIGLNAHLLASGANYRRAGIHGYIQNLLAHLPAAAPDLRGTVFVGAGDPPSNPAFIIRRARWVAERPLRRILWEQVIQPFQLSGCDLVHELAFVAPLVMPRPFVLTVYDLTFLRYPEGLPASRRLYLRTFTRLSCRRARRIMAISQSTATDLRELLGVPKEKIDLAIPGVDSRFAPLPIAEIATWRERMGLPERFLLFVGTLEPRKNLPMLLRAYAALPEKDRIPLVLAGGAGWGLAAIEATLDAHDLRRWVLLPGYVPDEALIFWYNAADAFVYPSVFEGWGMPVTEAMACGTPAFVSNVSSLPEAVGETGAALPPDDISAWTAALHQMIQDRAWRRAQGEAARMRAAQFTWENTARQTVASYKQAFQP
ncbi:MAG TPA: glycosyltransferase family 1 protein [Aggregatilineales bacterium]|nr:glycosyltransferase family 4 protein [Anaerolineales bacterium]HRE48320.1 glycosyltransferase family 1 protein [Aggregatilineales bacterium]